MPKGPLVLHLKLEPKNTMCALLIRDPAILRPRFVHLFLETAKEKVLVPLMCGATNVTMDDDQLAEVLIPVPSIEVQDEIIETHLVMARTTELLEAAQALLLASTNDAVRELAKKICEDVTALALSARERRDILTILSTKEPDAPVEAVCLPRTHRVL
jgi:type I restriction enzyme M protein